MNEESVHVLEVPDAGSVVGDCAIGTVGSHTLLVAQVMTVQHIDRVKPKDPAVKVVSCPLDIWFNICMLLKVNLVCATLLV